MLKLCIAGVLLITITLAVKVTNPILPILENVVKDTNSNSWWDNIILNLRKGKQEQDSLTRQLISQQFYHEQSVRSAGQSGIKLIRQRRSGTKSYFAESHDAAGIHEHGNHKRTMGMGEFAAVLNGAEFTTRKVTSIM